MGYSMTVNSHLERGVLYASGHDPPQEVRDVILHPTAADQTKLIVIVGSVSEADKGDVM